MSLYTHKTGVLALKPERQEACLAAGVKVLEFGESFPIGGILIADARPAAFEGERGPDDPAATALYVGSVFNPKEIIHFEDFDLALARGLQMATATASN